MAKISDETLNLVFDLQRRSLRTIHEGGYISFQLFEQLGETEETVIALEELDSIREKALSAFNKLNTLILLITQSQPRETPDAINLLESNISNTEALIPALIASIEEIKRNWDLS